MQFTDILQKPDELEAHATDMSTAKNQQSFFLIQKNNKVSKIQ